MSIATAPLERRGPRLPGDRRGWLSFAVGGGERGPLGFGEPEGEVEKGWVDDRVERLPADPGRRRGRRLT